MGNAALKQHFVKILEQHAPLLVKEGLPPISPAQFSDELRGWCNFLGKNETNRVDRTLRFQNMNHIEMKKHIFLHLDEVIFFGPHQT